jgi:hypothetical protein
MIGKICGQQYSLYTVHKTTWWIDYKKDGNIGFAV